MRGKKGIFGWDSSLSMITMVVVLLILITITTNIVLKVRESSPDEICTTTAIVASTTNIMGKATFQFKCPVRQWAFDVGKYGEIELGDSEPKEWIDGVKNPSKLKWFQPFVEEYDLVDNFKDISDAPASVREIQARSEKAFSDSKITKEALFSVMQDDANIRADVYKAMEKDYRKYQVMDQQDLMNKFITERMYTCVKKMGSGKLTLFDTWYAKFGAESFCVVCDTFDFSRLADVDKLNEDKFFEVRGPNGKTDLTDDYGSVRTLDNWMRLWSHKNEDVSYYGFFQHFNDDKGYLKGKTSTDDFLRYHVKPDEGANQIDYSIVYMEVSNPAWLDGITSAMSKNYNQIFGGSLALTGILCKYGGKKGCFAGKLATIVTGAGAFVGNAKDAVKSEKKTLAKGVYYVPVDMVPAMCGRIVNY